MLWLWTTMLMAEYFQDWNHPEAPCLWEAAQSGNAREIPRLLNVGVPVDLKDQNRTALMMACEAGHTAVASMLLLHDAAIDGVDAHGSSALLQAIERGDLEMALFLCERGANWKQPDHQGRDAVKLAEEKGLNQLAIYLQRGSHAAVNSWELKLRSFISTSPNPQPAQLSQLMLAGAQLNGPTNQQESPLIRAARQGRPRVVAAMLALGAYPWQQIRAPATGQMQGPLDVASDPRVHSLLLQYGARTQANFQRELLFKAAREGDARQLLQSLASLLYLSEDLDLFDLNGKSPLHHAVYYNHRKLVSLLVEAGADLNRPSQEGWTPLLWASARRNPLMLSHLTALGADPGLADAQGFSPLLLATSMGDINCVRALLAIASVSATTTTGDTALMYAVEADSRKLAYLLLEAGADANCQNQLGQSPLHLAAMVEKLGMAELLLDRGAEIDVRDVEGRTPLALAVAAGKRVMAQLLIDSGASLWAADARSDTPLDKALQAGHHRMVNLLLFCGADPDARCLKALSISHSDEVLGLLLGSERDLWETTKQETLLAILNNQPQKLTHLLEQNDNFLFHNGWTPAMLASVLERSELLQTLVEHGADLTAKTPIARNTSLHLAILKGDLAMLKKLKQLGADLNPVNGAGHTPLTLAVVNGHAHLVRWLLEAGAHRTAHHLLETLPALAAAIGDLEMLRTLDKLKFDMNLGNGYGWTPVMHAARANHLKVLQFLLRKGCLPNLRNKQGFTALMYAQKGRHFACVTALLAAGAYPDISEKQTLRLQ